MIAIHNIENSFSERWITYCLENNIKYKLVDCFAPNIIEELEDCEGLLWHWKQEDPKAKLVAKELTYALECAGKKVFPDFHTVWHFDDKIAQFYLLRALHLPVVPSYIFFHQEQALSWSKKTVFPKVFKLRGGAGSINVQLVDTKTNALKLIKKAFTIGFGPSGRTAQFYNRIWLFKRDRDFKAFLGILKGIRRLFLKSKLEKIHGNEKGYVYFQDYKKSNDSDIRVIVIGNICFAIKRMNREGDFRASGSGIIEYLNDATVDKKCLLLAFQTAQKVRSQCIALDFIYDDNGSPLIVEISYGFSMAAYDQCSGYWDDELVWHEGKFNPQYAIIQNFLSKI